MNLLDYKTIFVTSSKNQGRLVNIVAYTKKGEKYEVLSKNPSESHITYLQSIKASGKASSVYLKFEKEKIVAFACFGDLDVEIFQLKENISTCGASVINSLSYLNEDLNIILDLQDYEKEFVCGLVIGNYKYNFLNKEPSKINALSITGSEKIEEYIKIYNAQNFTRFLGDTPANLMTPSIFVEYAKEYCNGMNIEVYDKEFMEKKKMNLLLGVAQGSKQEPKLLKISYKPKSENEVDISLVGKGITFDSGGISLKPSANMSAMKGDMLGAAIVLSTIKLISDMKLNINVEAILPLTENLPSGCATKPGDVHIGMSGKSVEVDNTDAEGRLILADAIAFAQESNPKYLFDIATLTGAISIALGDNFIGYFTNDRKLGRFIYDMSIEANDPAWEMPLSSLFLNCMKSNVADLKNAGGRKGGSCTAAIFLKEFVNKEIKWTHFDIAGVDFDHRNKALFGKGMTGRGLGLLYEVVKGIAENK